ncbi:MAG: ArsR/SmtB family transcription factor [Leptospirales bacterium]
MDNKQAVILLDALAQDSRLAIFRLLVETGPGGLHATQIGKSLGIPAATLSFHLKELTHVGLIQKRKSGRFLYYATEYRVMNALVGFLTENCCSGQPCFPEPVQDGG